MTTRAQIDAAVTLYAGKPRLDIPKRYRDPKNEHDFALGMAILLAQMPQYRDAGPAYDENDNLIGWRGIRFKDGA